MSIGVSTCLDEEEEEEEEEEKLKEVEEEGTTALIGIIINANRLTPAAILFLDV